MKNEGHRVSLRAAALLAAALTALLALATVLSLSSLPGLFSLLFSLATLLALVLVATLGKVRREQDMKISKLRDTEQAARAADRAKTDFLANMSHEIRTPMHAVLGMAELLLDMDLSEEACRRLEVIQTSGEALLALIDDVLDFSRIEAGELTLTETGFDLDELLGKVVRLLRSRAEEKGIAFVFEPAPGLPGRVRGDAGRLRQVLLNLGGNAVKFTREGLVTLKVEPGERGAELRFTLADTGIGIAEGDQSRVFETFVQADSSSARRFGGSGLGLAISKELVGRMGGEIGLESERRVGSTFWFRLPLPEAPDDAESLEIDLPAHQGARAAFRILVVDDHAANRLVALSRLEALGYRANAAGGGLEALDYLEDARQDDQPYAAVLMDCQMPDLDGYETTRRLRARETEAGGSRVPVVAVTAHAFEGERQRCLGAGMDDYLPKPFRSAALAAVLDGWLFQSGRPLDDSPAPAPEDELEDSPDPEAIEALRRQERRTGRSLIAELVSSYVEEGRKLLEEMRQATADADAERLSRAAHRLGGSSSILGGNRLAQLCRELEILARGEDFAAMETARIEGRVETIASSFRYFAAELERL